MTALLPLHRVPAAGATHETAAQARLRRLFLEGFTVLDVAEDLCSFDADRAAADVAAFMDANLLDVVGVRVAGLVAGYAARAEMGSGQLGGTLRPFAPEDLLAPTASLPETIAAIARGGRAFVRVLDHVAAVVTPRDMEKAPVRMWLFGMITMLEMQLTRRIRAEHADGSWRDAITPERLRAAEALLAERTRRTMPGELVDCLQLGDKVSVLLKAPGAASALGFESNRQAKAVFRDLQRLRNNLAHTQDLLETDWDAIVRLAAWLERALAAQREDSAS